MVSAKYMKSLITTNSFLLGLREDAAKAKESLDGTLMHGIPMKLFWAKPPTDKTTKQEILRAREKRILHQQSLTPVYAHLKPEILICI